MLGDMTPARVERSVSPAVGGMTARAVNGQVEFLMATDTRDHSRGT